MQPQTRSVVALLSSVGCSSTAVALLTTVLGKQVFDLTGSSLALGLLGLAEFAPAALLVFVSGTLADRVERRKLASVGLIAQAVTIACIAWYSGTKPTSTLPIFVLVIAFGAAGAFATPATRALPADTVLPQIMAVQPRERVVTAARPRGGMREAVEGVRFVRSQPILVGAISLDLFAVLFGGAVALLPAIAETRLGVGAVGLGLLRAAVGIGAGSVTLFLTFRPVARRVGRTVLIAVAVFGLGTIALGATTSFVVAFIALAALSGADSVSVFIRSTLVPLVTPHEKRGRVLAVEAVFIGASNELGAFESGVVGQFLGPAVAIVLGGAATLAVAALWWTVFPSPREVDGFPVPVEP